MQATKYLIISMRRTGGNLVNNLLDGHRDCSVFPFEFWNTRKKTVYDALGHRTFAWMPARLKIAHCGLRKIRKKKFIRAHGPMRWPEFYDDLLGQAGRATSAAELYDLTAELYFTRYHPDGLGQVVVNHCGNLSVLSPEQLRTIFGEARYIMTIRDPRAAFASTERKDQRRLDERGRVGEVAYDRIGVEAYCDMWRRAVETYYLGTNRGIGLRFEDLVREPKKMMVELASAMDISFDDVLLTPTRIGEEKTANSSFARSAGIDPGAADSWRAHLSPQWRRVIEDRLGDVMERVGYRTDEGD
jgi:hypothetical protein